MGFKPHPRLAGDPGLARGCSVWAALCGNQHDEVDTFAFAKGGSRGASMWQNNKRKVRFVPAALSSDTSIRRLEDLDEGSGQPVRHGQGNRIGDQRLMQKAGLEAVIAGWSVCGLPYR